MKAIILSILIFIGIECEAQEQFTSLEWNAGVSASDADEVDYFPGGSYLIGTTYITKSNLVLDAQIGLAFPTLVTGKVGVGFKGENAIITAGIRPYPSHAYLQLQWLPENKNHSFIFSFEESAYSMTGNDDWYGPSTFSIRLATVGYRWNLGSKFGRK
ncbi:hypothetical protein N8Z92_00075 [Schleiferiaceae bacterium]|nr:hypothetical protein [Schleiferiaceae bacterium]MDC1530377.1 hypothetical protein [Schleiferiaceae bacterium]